MKTSLELGLDLAIGASYTTCGTNIQQIVIKTTQLNILYGNSYSTRGLRDYELERDSTPVAYRGFGCTEAIYSTPVRQNDLTGFAVRRPNSQLPHIGFAFSSHQQQKIHNNMIHVLQSSSTQSSTDRPDTRLW